MLLGIGMSVGRTRLLSESIAMEVYPEINDPQSEFYKMFLTVCSTEFHLEPRAGQNVNLSLQQLSNGLP